MDTVLIPVLEVNQPVGKFFLGVLEARDLLAISYADVRRPEGRDLERYIGTQRDLSEGRVSEIKKYVKTVDACFPSGIILAISSQDVETARTPDGQLALEVKREARVAKIIDGQHRIAGFEGFNGDPFFVNVTVFVDMDLEDQAMIFATINLKQTKVSKSLAYDLYDFAEARSPHKTCHNIAKLMNFKDGSPLKGFIKILGKATDQELESITQATFVDRLLKLISTDPMIDKDLIKRGQLPDRATGTDSRKLLLRNWFLDEADAQIALLLWEYFQAVKKRWPTAWHDRAKGAILGRTTGFAALLRLLPDVVTRLTDGPLGDGRRVPKMADFKSLLDLVEIQDTDFVSTVFLPGSSGEGKLLAAMQGFLQKVPQKW